VDAADAPLADEARCTADAPDDGIAADGADAPEAGCVGDAVDEDDVAPDDGTSDAAKADRSTSTEIGSAAASHMDAATARVRQRGLGSNRVRSESIIRSRPSADPAAAQGERRVFRASHRHAAGIACLGADASSRWSRSRYNAFGTMAANESSGLSFYPRG
jgi:hypothetical protein